MSNFDELLDELSNGGHRSSLAPQRADRGFYNPAARRKENAQFAKAVADMATAQVDAVHIGRRIAEDTKDLRIENIRSRARVLIEQTRKELLAAISEGLMPAIEAAKAESFLNSFAAKMGL